MNASSPTLCIVLAAEEHSSETPTSELLRCRIIWLPAVCHCDLPPTSVVHHDLLCMDRIGLGCLPNEIGSYCLGSSLDMCQSQYCHCSSRDNSSSYVRVSTAIAVFMIHPRRMSESVIFLFMVVYAESRSETCNHPNYLLFIY